VWKYILAVVVVILGANTQAHAAGLGPSHINVSITCSCDDAMGKAYGQAVRDLVAHDAHYREVAQDAEEGATLRIHIISMPITTSEGMPGAALSIVCMHNGSLMHEFLTTCAHIPIADCAKNMVDGLSDISD
jgi:hypothetical protein